jgi:hypothetical protein
MKFLNIFFLIILCSCAKPTVVDVKLPDDNNLNCEQLEIAVAESEKIKKEAKFAKEGTGGNLTRLILFWPAWAQTLHNADVAIEAADHRIFHLFKLMKKKNCKNIDIINNKIINNTTVSGNNIAEQLKDLKKMYDSGDLTEREYKKAKDKVLE